MLKKTIIYFLSSGIQSSAGVLTILLVQNMLGARDIATFAIFSVVLSIFDSFSGMNSFGLYEARFYSNTKKNNEVLISNLIYVTVFGLALILSFLLLADSILSLGTDLSEIGIFWIFSAAVISNLKQFQNILLTKFQYNKKYWNFLILNASNSLVILGLTYLFLNYSDPSWISRVIPQIIITIVLFLISIIIFHKEFSLKLKLSFEMIKSLLKYGLPLIPHKISMLLISVGGQLVIEFFLDNDLGLSNYFIALKFGIIILVVVDVSNRIYSPDINLIIQKKSEGLNKIILKSFLNIFLFSILFTTLLTFFGHYFLNKNYLESLDYLPYICLGFLFHGCYTILINTFFFEEKTILISKLSLISGITAITSMIILVNIFGVFGVVIGFVFGQFVKFFVVLIKFLKNQRIKRIIKIN